jgi:methionyl-tRNA formyltransferase
MKNIVFMGTPDFATNIFKELYSQKDINIQALFTQPDKAVGRKQIMTSPDIKRYVLEKNIDIDIYQPSKLRDIENIEILQKLKPDFIIVCAYAQILPSEILKIAPCINLHASILPKYRGASPIQASILNNDTKTGVTAMLMNEGLDTGDILSLSFVDISSDILVTQLFDVLSRKAAILAVYILKEFENIIPKQQLDCLSTHTSKIKKSDGFVTLDDAQRVYTKYRAFYGWPTIYVDDNFKLLDISINEKDKKYTENMKILDIKKDYITVSCFKGSLNIRKLQMKSKNKMSAVEYIKGRRKKIGDSLL